MDITPISSDTSETRMLIVKFLTPIITDNHDSRQVSVRFAGLPMNKSLIIWDSSSYYFKDLSDEGINAAVFAALGDNPDKTLSDLCA
jgi:hypothetical protein